MQCPHCGSLTRHRHKVEMNRRALAGHGGWLHEVERSRSRDRAADPCWHWRCPAAEHGCRELQSGLVAAAAFASWEDRHLLRVGETTVS